MSYLKNNFLFENPSLAVRKHQTTPQLDHDDEYEKGLNNSMIMEKATSQR